MFPEFREVLSELAQFVIGLERTAPAGHPMKNIIQPIPIEAPLFAVCQAVRFGHTPINKGIIELSDTLRLVSGDADILHQGVFLGEITQIAVDDSLLQHSRTPSVSGTWPAKADPTDQLRVLPLGGMLQHEVFKGFIRFEPCNRSADVLLQLVDVVIQTFKLHARVTEQDNIHRHTFLQHSQKHSRGVLAPGERNNMQFWFFHFTPPSYKQNAPVIVDRSTIIIATADRTVERHYGGDSAVNFLCGFFFVRLDVSGGVGADEDVVHHPAENRMSAVCEFLFQGQLHQFFGRRTHILKALSERNDRKTHTLKVLHHLHRAPAVKGNLSNVVSCSEFFNEFFNVTVMHHIALGSLQKALPFPKVIHHMVTPHTQVNIVFRYPKERQNHIFIILILRREHQHKSGNIRSGGKVKTAVTYTPLQTFRVYGKGAGVPFVHRHPADSLFDPLVQTKLTEGVFLAGVLLCRFTGGLDLVDADRNAERGVCLFPHLRVSPILVLGCAIDDRIKSRVMLAAVKNVQCLLVCLIADGLRIRSGCGDQKVERLHSCIAGAFGHNIKQLSVRLGVQLIKDNAVGVEAVLVGNIGGQYLVEAVGGQIGQPLLRFLDFHTLGESRTEPDHIHCHIKHDLCLVAVGGTAVHLGTFLTVTAGQQKSDCGGKLGFALLLWNFNVGGVELTVAIGLECAEHITNDLLLPVDEFKGLSRPGAFGVAEAFDKHDRKICGILIVAAVFGFEAGRLVVFQLAQMRSPP
nr:MAG TPA: hypothetical protein [Caudoviricetes sp.]